MAIGKSGYYGLTLEKQLIDTAAFSLESTNIYALLVTDGYTPLFSTHDFVADITNQIPNQDGYTTGGKALDATPSLTLESPATEQIAYDSADVLWASSTITDAMAAVLYDTTGSTATDALVLLSDFQTAVSTSNGTLTVAVATNGWFYIDYA